MNEDKHPELNSIAFINLNKTDEDLSKESKIAAKYLISILKTNILKRFFVQGENLEIKDYILINKDFLYIYPPKPYNSSLLNLIADESFKFQNNYSFFGEFLYDYLTKDIKNVYNESMILHGIFISIDYDYIDVVVCLNIPFHKKLYEILYLIVILDLIVEIVRQKLRKIFMLNLINIKS